jgi:para-aminobenzoate synthetase component 1
MRGQQSYLIITTLTMRKIEHLNLTVKELRSWLIPFLASETHVAICDSCDMPSAASIQQYQMLIAWGKHAEIIPNEQNAFEEIMAFHKAHEDWIFGIFSYDLKNSLEDLKSQNPHPTQTPPAAFFVPEHLIIVNNAGEIFWMSHSWDVQDLNRFLEIPRHRPNSAFSEEPLFVHNVDRDRYVEKVESIKEQILEGNVYELNYCHEFHACPANLKTPIRLFEKIRHESPAPFAAYFCLNDWNLIGCSPERFLQRRGQRLISQPIKGTAPRRDDPEEDAAEKQKLSTSEKEKAENVMIVDLVRNDFARSCLTGSIQVKELFGIYSFPRVHQLISTIEGIENEHLTLLQSLKNAFPMGSMTGAPKIAAMKLIDELEENARGWYSGAFGYISPNGDFDFNVVIRSFVYNRKTDYLSVMAGGAITIDSDPLQEYEESLLKARYLLLSVK